MPRKKILVFSDWFSPGFMAGGPIKSLMNMIGNVEADFYVVTRINDYHSAVPYAGIKENEATRFSENCVVQYINENRMNTRFVEDILECDQFDFYYLNSLFSPRFTLLPLSVIRKKKRTRQCIIAPRGMLKTGALQVKPLKKKIFLWVAKRRGWYSGVLWHATNPDEVSEIQRAFGVSSRIKLAPVIPSSVPVEKKIRKEKDSLRLVSFSRISAEKGILEAIRIVKNLPDHHSVCFDIYGAIPPGTYADQCREEAGQSTHTITLKGQIEPSFIPELYSGYDVFFLATHGENFGHAIAEALLNATPVIITDRTPWRNLQDRHAGFDVPMEESALAAALIRFLEMDSREFEIWQKGASETGLEAARNPETLLANHKLFE